MMLGFVVACPRLCSFHCTNSSFLFENASSTISFPTSIHRLREPRLGFRVIRGVRGRERIRFSVSVRNQRKGDDTVLEMDGIGDGDDEDEWDDEDVVVPFPNMKRWLQNKPIGFGEGKVYDTRIEEKLLEEIEQSRVAQLANIIKLKKNPAKPNSEKANNQEQKGLSLYCVNDCRIVC